jgi:Ras-related protein Rab-1A
MTKFNVIYTYILYSLLIGNFCYGSTVDKKYKIVLIGDPAVGKTSLIRQATKNIFGEDYISTINDNKTPHEYKDENGTKYNFDIWDTVGQIFYTTTNKIFCKNANGIMAVYSITDGESFKHLEDIINRALEITGEETPVMIVANKSDLFEDRVVENENGKDLAKKYNGEFYATSATTYKNTYPAFEKLFDIVIEDVKEQEEEDKNRKEQQIQTIEHTSDDDNNHHTYKCCWCC